MARPLRIEYGGALYHVTSRGDRQKAIFDDDQDRRAFLHVLGDVVSRFRWCCHAYYLMGNHTLRCKASEIASAKMIPREWATLEQRSRPATSAFAKPSAEYPPSLRL